MTSPQTAALLLALAVIIVAAGGLGLLARRLGQPAVIGEVMAGILIGPTLFGGAIAARLLPADIRPFLSALASVGVAVFMLLIGLELDSGMRRMGRVAASVSVASIVLPSALGVGLGLYLLRRHPSDDRLGFLLFMGVAMSITAFPVLARILTDRGIDRLPVGRLALSCAAIDDVLAWTMLAAVVAIVGDAGGAWRIALAVPYLLVMVYPVRRGLRRLTARVDRVGAGLVSIVLVGALLSGAVTEWIGLHFIFGAFLFGVIFPRTERPGSQVGAAGPRTGPHTLRGELRERIMLFNNTLLLPVFFIVAGLRVDLSAVGGADLVELLLILLVAIGGKFVGAYVAARLNGIERRLAATLATLMNTRGLTELIILNVGLQLGVIDTRLYSLLVVMAVVTTAMAGPLLAVLLPGQRVRREADPALNS